VLQYIKDGALGEIRLSDEWRVRAEMACMGSCANWLPRKTSRSNIDVGAGCSLILRR